MVRCHWRRSRLHLLKDSMELFLYILFWICIWMTIGVLTAFIKMFVLFRSPVHMLQLYLLHPKTKMQTAALVQIASKRTKNITMYIMGVQYVFAAIFMPLAVVELIFDLVLFTNFDPSKIKKTNEEPHE